MDKLLQIDKYIARLLMVSFFLPMKLQVAAVIVACVYFVCRTFQSGQRISGKSMLLALLLGSGYLLYVLAIPLTPPLFQHRLLTLCGNRISFLVMPIVFAIITPGFGATIRRQLVWFVYGCIICCLFANILTLYSYASTEGAAHSLTHVGYRIGFEQYSHIHPTYMAMYLAFSMCVLLYGGKAASRMGTIAKYVLLYLLVMFFLALLAKATVLALVIIVIHYAATHRRSVYQYKTMFFGIFLVMALAWFFIPFVSQRVNETIQMMAGSKSATVVGNSLSARKLIWNTDMTLLKQYWLTGVGPGRVYQSFHERYFFYYLAHGPVGIINDPHNEYLFEWLAFGLLGIIVFGSIFVAYLVRAIKAKDHLFLYLLIILYVTFFTETVLATQRGLLFYAVFTALFFFINYRNSDNGISSPVSKSARL